MNLVSGNPFAANKLNFQRKPAVSSVNIADLEVHGVNNEQIDGSDIKVGDLVSISFHVVGWSFSIVKPNESPSFYRGFRFEPVYIRLLDKDFVQNVKTDNILFTSKKKRAF